MINIKVYKYFITYQYHNPHSLDRKIASTIVKLNRKIETEDDILDVQKQMKHTSGNCLGVTILAYSKLKDCIEGERIKVL